MHQMQPFSISSELLAISCSHKNFMMISENGAIELSRLQADRQTHPQTNKPTLKTAHLATQIRRTLLTSLYLNTLNCRRLLSLSKLQLNVHSVTEMLKKHHHCLINDDNAGCYRCHWSLQDAALNAKECSWRCILHSLSFLRPACLFSPWTQGRPAETEYLQLFENNKTVVNDLFNSESIQSCVLK